MSKYSEEETYFIFNELKLNSKLDHFFHLEILNLRNDLNFKHREINELYALAYANAKKKIENENIRR